MTIAHQQPMEEGRHLVRLPNDPRGIYVHVERINSRGLVSYFTDEGEEIPKKRLEGGLWQRVRDKPLRKRPARATSDEDVDYFKRGR